jgi:hypothetical protein
MYRVTGGPSCFVCLWKMPYTTMVCIVQHISVQNVSVQNVSVHREHVSCVPVCLLCTLCVSRCVFCVFLRLRCAQVDLSRFLNIFTGRHAMRTTYEAGALPFWFSRCYTSTVCISAGACYIRVFYKTTCGREINKMHTGIMVHLFIERLPVPIPRTWHQSTPLFLSWGRIFSHNTSQHRPRSSPQKLQVDSWLCQLC